MYSTRPGLILGFHGTDQSVVREVLLGNRSLEYNRNAYDWLGNGNYFWENSPSRALHYATLLKSHPERTKIPIRTPAVIGAVISLGNCLDFTDIENLELLKIGYSIVQKTMNKASIPVNRKVDGTDDVLLRELDCLVIETLHKALGEKKYDSVRGVFWEGKEPYPTAGFKERNHIQICVRNPNCIKGFFLPRLTNGKYKAV